MKKPNAGRRELRDAVTGRSPRPPVEHGIRGITVYKPAIGPAPKWGSEPWRRPPAPRTSR
jgi:hypothetical protein